MIGKPKILITGFSPFPGAPENPTQVLVSLFTQRIPELDAIADFEAVTLPTEYAYVDAKFSALMEEINPDITLHFGLKQSAIGFTLEQVAHNVCNIEREDISGAVPEIQKIDPSGPASLASSLPLAQIHKALQLEGLPVEISDDAGNYVCNYLFFRSQQLARENTLSGFIHVPLLDTQTDDNKLNTLTKDQLWAGVMVIVETVIAAWQQMDRV